ncbi:protein lethal(2)essential for life-like [Venturia canescens]|uniref:protein lethal(2)essential for life-like n=1 Tax=Venturia canescens TaxID=32260 RepID=UPI001C9CEA8A|nr:protein lethal(2)essential for life-like [Venturia canescens]
MSLIPMLYSDWWEDLDRPHSLLDQHFGLPADPEEISSQRAVAMNRHAENLGYPFFRRMRRRHHPFHHALARKLANNNKGGGHNNTDRDKFVINLDVKQFGLDEIVVKLIEKSVVVVDAKHEEKEDEHGWISRQFTRKYNVPPYYDTEQIESFLSSDGILTITAPKRKSLADTEKFIKIQYTGEPAVFDKQNSKSPEAGHVEEFSRNHPQQRAPHMSQQQRGKKINVKGI